jgi:hypothetical protein
MRITGVETILFEPVWDDPYAAAHRRVHAALKVHTDAGLVGIGRLPERRGAPQPRLRVDRQTSV